MHLEINTNINRQCVWFIQTLLKPEVLKPYKSTIFMKEFSGPNDTDLRLSRGKPPPKKNYKYE